MAKRVDNTLFARRGPDNVVRVLQKTRSGDSFVFAITPGFDSRGESAEIGLEKVFEQFQKVTLENRDKMFEEMEREVEAKEYRRKRERMNTFEDFASELRPILNKTLGNVLTHNMDKAKDPRRRYERKKQWL